MAKILLSFLLLFLSACASQGIRHSGPNRVAASTSPENSILCSAYCFREKFDGGYQDVNFTPLTLIASDYELAFKKMMQKCDGGFIVSRIQVLQVKDRNHLKTHVYAGGPNIRVETGRTSGPTADEVRFMENFCDATAAK